MGFGGVIVDLKTLVSVSDEVPTVVRFGAAERKWAKIVLLLKPVAPKESAGPVSGPLVNVEPPLSPSPATPAAVTLARMIEPETVSLMYVCTLLFVAGSETRLVPLSENTACRPLGLMRIANASPLLTSLLIEALTWIKDLVAVSN